MQILKSKKEKVLDLLKQKKADTVKHARGSLYDHLLRTCNILEEWEMNEDICMAGLLHSVYDTEYFKGHIIDISEEKKVIGIVGEKCNELIKLFAIADRYSFNYDEVSSKYYTKNYKNKEALEMSGDIGKGLLHIMMANDLDQTMYFVFGQQMSEYNKYARSHNQLCTKAKRELYKIVRPESLDAYAHNKNNNIRDIDRLVDKSEIVFTGHSGMTIRSANVSVAIDPWLYPSTHAKPLIEGLHPRQNSIDYLIPEPRNNPADISPDIVLLSHFHTHHSPLREIIEFAKLKPIKIYCPELNAMDLDIIKQKMGDYIYGRITFVFLNDDIVVNDMGAEIRAFKHHGEEETIEYGKTNMLHFMFYVKLLDKSLLQIVDATADKKDRTYNFDDSWNRLFTLKVDYLFVGGVGHAFRTHRGAYRTIIEHTSLSPVQAAKLAAYIGVKYAGLIGMFNHSVWDDRAEKGLSSEEAISTFTWALDWIAPSIQPLYLRPGDRFY